MKDLWLDLELRKDIDDYATLIYAIEKKYPIKHISINNPSINEIKLLNFTIEKFNLNLTPIISGHITEYNLEEDIHESLFLLIEDYNNTDFIHIDLLKKTLIHDYTVFCGGSLTTLSILYTTFDYKPFNAYIQGGFASYHIVEKEFLLKKFKKREKVPSWNLNLDIKATEIMLNSDMDIHFISKNICHNSFVSVNDLSDSNSFFNTVLKNYFLVNKYDSKCMHDLLAFLSIDSDIVTFKPVNLFFTDDDIAKFWSVINVNSKHCISVSYCNTAFLAKILAI